MKPLKVIIVAGVILAACIALTKVGMVAVDAARADGIAAADAGASPQVAPTGIATSPVIDPVAQPGEAASRVAELWKSGAIPAALIIAVWSLLLLARRWISWLSVGKRAVYLGIAVTFVGAFVERAAAGTTPTLSMLLAAAATAVGSLRSPAPSANAVKGQVVK